MAETYRVLTTPVRVATQPPLGQLATLVAADALVRRARAVGLEADWRAASLTGDLAGQRAVERELARAGHDRASLGREAFVERVREMEAACRAEVESQLAALDVSIDLSPGSALDEHTARAARIAFVRLFEEGLVREEERVVNHCPRCETVVEAADAEHAEVPGERLVLRIPVLDAEGELAVATLAPEFLPAVAAVVVPEGHPCAGGRAVLPLDAGIVPIVVADPLTEPAFVVPAHDPVGFEDGRLLGVVGVHVLDADGVVRATGPLDGLQRFAARAAARDLLAAEGAIVFAEPATEVADRCRRCRTVLVPRRGRHWFLRVADLEVAAADAVRDASVTFSPSAARDDFLGRAGEGGDWCLSHQVWAGQPVPAARCLDCGGTAVGVELPESCGKCMGLLQPDDSVLDARFVSAVWPLAVAGWPDDATGPTSVAAATTLLVGPPHLSTWVLAVAALGLRLAGALPFAHVAVHTGEGLADETSDDDGALTDVLARVGMPVVRAALAGGLDVEEAERFVAGVADPADAEGENDVDELVARADEAYRAGDVGRVMALLGAALDGGVRANTADRVRALAAPVVAR